jgi:hypothetical protein
MALTLTLTLTPYPLQTCSSELHLYCGGVKPTEALGCLELHMGGADFGAPCATAVRATIKMAVTDYRLHPKARSTIL